MDSSVGLMSDGDVRARSFVRRTHVLRRLPNRSTTSGARVAAGHGTDGKHRDDNYDDDQRGTGDPPADRRLLLL